MELILPSQALQKLFIGSEIYNQKTVSALANDAITVSYHAFRINNIEILIPLDIISEVADDLAFCKLPNTSKVLYGMANLRGNIIPIFDLHAQLKIEAIHISRKILVIGKGNDAIAILIDELPKSIGIRQQDKCAQIPILPEFLQQYLKTSYQVNNKIWLELDLKALFVTLSEFI